MSSLSPLLLQQIFKQLKSVFSHSACKCMCKKGKHIHTFFSHSTHLLTTLAKILWQILQEFYKGESSTDLALRELKCFSFIILECCQMRGRKECVIILSNKFSFCIKKNRIIVGIEHLWQERIAFFFGRQKWN